MPNLIPVVASAARLWSGPKPTLNYLEAGYLKDLANGATYSMKHSPYSVRKILRALIDCKVAHVPFERVDGVESDMVCITDYGEACLNG